MESSNLTHLISAKLNELKICDQILKNVPTTKDALLKRCQIFLVLRLYTKALVTSDLILQTDPTDLRTTCYKTKALFGLGRYQESISFLSKALRTLKSSNVTNNINYINKDRHLKILNNHLKEANFLLNQQTNGIYDMSSFVPNRKVKFDNISEFIGPIQIGTNIPGKGRGVISTKDIQPGQLILASRAFEIVFDDDDEDDWNLEMAIAQKLTLDPEQANIVYQLHAGQDLGFLEGNLLTHVNNEVVNTENSTENACKASEPKTIQPLINLERITGICNMNSFGNSQNTSGYGHDSRGLWILPSYINHDCVDFNCIWKCLGDFLFIRAIKLIKEGQEILISYTDSAEPLPERVKFFQAHDFLCQCRLCQFENSQDSANPVERDRKLEIFRLVEEMSKSSLFQVRDGDGDLELKPDFKDKEDDILKGVNILENYLQELVEIGIKSGKPEWNFSLHLVLDLLSKLYYQQGDAQKYMEMAQRYYQVVNGSGACLEVGAAGQVATYFLKGGDLSGALKWINILKKDLTLVYGDSNVFQLIYPVLYAEAINCGLSC